MQFDFSKEPGKCLLERGLNIDANCPLISVITPFYNAGAYFEQTFNCVMNQTFPWFEWIIVDDGSTKQEDVNYLESFARKDSRIKVVHKENGGIASARNRGIAASCTEIIVPLDADDLISETYLEILYWALYFNPEAAWAYSDSVGFGAEEYVWKKEFSALRMKRENLLVCTAAIRKKQLLEVGCYQELATHFNEDWHTWLNLLSKGYYPVRVSEEGFWYRRHHSGVLNKVKTDKAIAKKAQELIREAGKKVSEEVPAVQFPRGSSSGKYHPPKKSAWDRKTFQKHEKINVLMLLPWLEMGGADLFNLDICQRLDKSRFEISILTTVQSENSWKPFFREHVTDLFTLPNFVETKDYPEFISYIIRSREIDVLFLSNSYYGYYMMPWLRKEFPDLAIIDYVHMEEWYWRNGGFARISGTMGAFVDKTYVCNERTRQVMIRDFARSPESVETLYIGVDHGKYDQSKVDKGTVYETYGIDADRPIVLFPCRIHPQKRPFLMVEIAKKLKKEIQNIALVVVGDGPQLEELRIAVEHNGLADTIYLAGRQNDMLPYYRDSAVTLICSLKEGLALTAYESLSMGVPVVTSDVGGQAELIDEQVGSVVPLLQNEADELDSRDFSEEEVGQYVMAIKRLLGNKEDYLRISEACRARIEERFSAQLMIEKLERIMTDLASEDARQRRRERAQQYQPAQRVFEELLTLCGEVESYERTYKNAYAPDTKNELMRIANSKWGSRLIKLAFKLKLNRLFRA